MSLEGQIPSLDINRTVRIALVHDIGEALIGDITPHCGVSEEDKQNLEAEVEYFEYIGKKNKFLAISYSNLLVLKTLVLALSRSLDNRKCH